MVQLRTHHDRIPPPAIRKQRLTETLDRLVQLYDAWGKKEEAAEWRQELEGGTGVANVFEQGRRIMRHRALGAAD